MASNLFEFINEMFSKPEDFQKTKMHERGKNFFMINRLCSIQFPIQASYFNHIKIHPGQAVTFWQKLLSAKYNRTPGWMYVKTAKAKEAKKAQQIISDETMHTYCKLHKISYRDLQDAINILGDSAYDELKQFESMTKQ